MDLELEAGDGGGTRVIALSSKSPATDLGRGDLAVAPTSPADRTVSRRHVSLRLLGGGEPRVSFEVVGRNPVSVRSAVGGDKVYRSGEAGELREGDLLSLSLKAPLFWKVRRTGGEAAAYADPEVDTAVLDAVARRERRTRERKERERRAVEEAMEVTEEEETAAAGEEEFNAEVEDFKIDLASIDPVREFGFFSMGHEFDNYPKGRIRPPKDWNWFLEEIRKSCNDEDDDDVIKPGRKSRGSSSGNKKKKEEGDDEEWTGESEDDKDSLPTGPSLKRPTKYVTRSKDPKKSRKENSKVKTENEDAADEEDEMDEEDDEDEMLGGFIVTEEDEAMEGLNDEQDEEEEFDDEDDDD